MILIIGWLLSLFTPSFARSAPLIEPKQFQEWLLQSQHSPPILAPDARLRARRYHYTFVKGFLNETMPTGYFWDHIAELQSLGVTHDHIHVVSPCSGKSFDENQLTVKQELTQPVLDSDDEPEVIVAHSRAARDVLAFALLNPTFVREHVKAIFLIQGALLGSSVADYIKGEGPPIDRRVPSAYRIELEWIGKTARTFGGMFGIDTGFAELTHLDSAEFLDSIFASHPDAAAMISDKIFYIQGSKNPAHVSPLIRATAHYLQYSCKIELNERGESICPNDGLVATHEQWLPGIGTSLAVFNADHTDLTNSWPISSEGNRKRLMLTRAIFTSVAQSESGCEAIVAGAN